jgi:hypothetical protein
MALGFAAIEVSFDATVVPGWGDSGAENLPFFFASGVFESSWPLLAWDASVSGSEDVGVTTYQYTPPAMAAITNKAMKIRNFIILRNLRSLKDKANNPE